MELLDKYVAADQLKIYFKKLQSLIESGEKYPVFIDEVWPLVYERKDHAIRDLKNNFLESIDYQFLPKNGENKGRPTDNYKLSIECLEYFIVKKVRAIFEVYRIVFHNKIEKSIPKTYSEALRLAADEYDKRIIAESKVKELTPKAEVYDQISDSTNLKTMGEAAKILGTGRTRLFEILKCKQILMKSGVPYQEFIDRGYFKVKSVSIAKLKENYPQTFVTGSGLTWLAKTLWAA